MLSILVMVWLEAVCIACDLRRDLQGREHDWQAPEPLVAFRPPQLPAIGNRPNTTPIAMPNTASNMIPKVTKNSSIRVVSTEQGFERWAVNFLQ